MLSGDHDLRATNGLAVDVFNCDLTLGVRLQIIKLAGAALFGQHFKDLVCEIDRRRHERVLLVNFALGAGEAEHHSLIARALFLAALFLLGVHAHGDVGRLTVQQHFDVGAIVGEAILIVADIPDHIARDLGDQLAIDNRLIAVLAEQRCLTATFAGDNDLVGGGKRLAAEPRVHKAVVGDAEFDVIFEKCIEHCVRNLIADLVRMAFGDRLAGE